ncbi:RagB/SusD family nutrient uptake outer membrane protein [Chitinophaga vietnamensis]|uniref:RagB/SusD family nutrient uptake outer membrane protein n=1 Tax=Chitinophaga vietnamensis TaxID=2593957 RepID=UPI0011787694|nr:RagB/SusD family nutrient uptake outer membrane protein [Chitinophaga vietnamensis]
MNKVLKNILIAALVTGGISSCNKYLDVKPETSVLQDDAYQSETGFMQHLNGVYLALSAQDMYGGAMTMQIPDLLAQRYFQSASPTHYSYYEIATFDYTNTVVKPVFAAYWASLYKQIANVNTILDHIDGQKNVFTHHNYEMIKGEALALRAFLHFDALRMFGPVYKSSDSTRNAIPYYSRWTQVPQPFLPANQVIDSLLRDVQQASALLSQDPVILNGPNGDPTYPYAAARNLRFNYYAVKALEARIHLYRGNKANAFAAAQTVIAAQPGKFPFTATNDGAIKADPSLLGDCLFMAQNTKLVNSYNTWFAYTLQDADLLAPRADMLNSIYADASDVRIRSAIWNLPPDGSRTIKCFLKYAPLSQQKPNTMVPLFRASECYLIAAESAPDATSGLGYLNTLRVARNIAALPANAMLNDEIRKEYMREFYGEGQLFYYYKRTFATSIPNAATTSSSGKVTMSATQYVVPIPDQELTVHHP